MRTAASAGWTALALAAALAAGCPDGAAAASGRVELVASCRVTRPGGDLPAAARGFNYGNRSIAVALWRHGDLVAGPLEGGGQLAEINPDGSISAKLGWWRGVEGRLRVTGSRLDAKARRLKAEVPDGYGSKGFQPTGLTFPTTGCWRVRGSVGRAHLSFVVRVSYFE